MLAGFETNSDGDIESLGNHRTAFGNPDSKHNCRTDSGKRIRLAVGGCIRRSLSLLVSPRGAPTPLLAPQGKTVVIHPSAFLAFHYSQQCHDPADKDLAAFPHHAYAQLCTRGSIDCSPDYGLRRRMPAAASEHWLH